MVTMNPAQRDMVIMRHELEVKWPGGGREAHTSTLIHAGEGPGGDTAMSTTVGLCAAAVRRRSLA